MTFEYDEEMLMTDNASIKVVGVGGAGCNALNRMINEQLKGVKFIAINTDTQVLEFNRAEVRLQIGANLTKGRGVGGDPDKGRKAMEEDRDHLAELLMGTDMIFITAGMGGGTGTGASPIVAEVAKELGILTVGVVTKPFHFEGKVRMARAEEGIKQLREQVDTLIVIPNQRLISIVEQGTSLIDAFRIADSILCQATKGISDLITVPGLVNVDFADVQAVMKDGGEALMGAGHASGSNRAVEAATQAISSPLLEEVSIEGAEGVLVNICGNKEFGLHEAYAAANVIHEAVGTETNTNIKWGAVIDDSMRDELSVTVIAAGFNKKQPKQQKPESVLKELTNPHITLQEREKPTYTRIPKPAEDDWNIRAESVFSGNAQGGFAPEDLDIPAFLRKKMD
jgi:cell division protein FtsZ